MSKTHKVAYLFKKIKQAKREWDEKTKKPIDSPDVIFLRPLLPRYPVSLCLHVWDFYVSNTNNNLLWVF